MQKISSNQETHLFTIAKNAGLGIGGRLFFLLIRFCIALLVARTIGSEQYGIYVLAVSIIALVETLGLLGLKPAMVKFVAEYIAQEDIARLKGIIRFGLKVSLVSTLILTIAVFLSAEFIAETVLHKTILAPVLRVVLLGLPFFACMQILLSVLQGAKLVKYGILVQQLFMPLFRLVLITIAFWLGFQLMGVVCAWVIATVAGFVLAIFFVTTKVESPFEGPAIVEGKKVIIFSLPLLLSILLNQNVNTVGTLVVAIFLPAAQIGIFGVAMRAIPFLLIPIVAYNAIFPPIISDLFAKGKMEELARIYKTGTKWVTSITLPLFVLMIFFSDQIMSIFGASFAGSADIMRVLLTGQMANVVSGSSGWVLSMTGKTLYNLFNSLTLFAVNIILIILMIDRLGLIGAAYAYSAAMIIVQLIQIIEVWILYKMHPYSIEYAKPLLSCLTSFFIIYLLDSYFEMSNHIIAIMGLVAIFLCSYAFFLALAGLSVEDREILGKFRQRISSVLIRNT